MRSVRVRFGRTRPGWAGQGNAGRERNGASALGWSDASARLGWSVHHASPDRIWADQRPRNVPRNVPIRANSTPTGTSCRLNAPATTGAEAIPPMFAVLATAMLKSSVRLSFA